jgi:hypothetical protein
VGGGWLPRHHRHRTRTELQDSWPKQAARVATGCHARKKAKSRARFPTHERLPSRLLDFLLALPSTASLPSLPSSTPRSPASRNSQGVAQRRVGRREREREREREPSRLSVSGNSRAAARRGECRPLDRANHPDPRPGTAANRSREGGGGGGGGRGGAAAARPPAPPPRGGAAREDAPRGRLASAGLLRPPRGTSA